ncbi:MAG: hypothetical protein JW719_02495 [Pirellulales bacterium]|nr:hypothetical protein [Pirellulales bacterium]
MLYDSALNLFCDAPSVDVGPCGSAPYENPKAAERRVAARYLFTKPMAVIPILPDHSPDSAFRGDAISSDISASGMGFEIDALRSFPGRRMLIGVEGDDGLLYYATVEVRNQCECEGRLRVGVRFVPHNNDLLRWENLFPTLQPCSYQFATGLPESTLRRWVEIGVLEPFLADRPLLCPRCHALPTYHQGCKQCGSARLDNQRLIHHFPCAYVGYTEEFDRTGEMICPKCRVRNLVVGADYEYLQGPHRCADCGWSGTDLETVGYCLACHWRFTLRQAWQAEFIGYHVNRLDPLAIIGPT